MKNPKVENHHFKKPGMFFLGDNSAQGEEVHFLDAKVIKDFLAEVGVETICCRLALGPAVV